MKVTKMPYEGYENAGYKNAQQVYKSALRGSKNTSRLQKC
jgi:hypothetical protein